MINLIRFFPKQFPQKFSLPHAMNARFAIFQKCRIAHFARIPASTPNLMQPTLPENFKNSKKMEWIAPENFVF